MEQEIEQALRNAGLLTYFRRQALARQQECLEWIARADRLETRQQRISKLISMLSTKRAKTEQ